MYEEFFGIEESEQYAFYRVPKLLFTNERYRNLSAESKLLYGLFLDRMGISQKNGWIDKDGRVYIIYTVEDIMEALGCGNKKAIQLLAELEKKGNLIWRKKQGLGKPNLIYMKKFILPQSNQEEHFLKCENDTSGNGNPTSLEMSKGHGNNTNKNNLNDNNMNLSFPSGDFGMEHGTDGDYSYYHEYFFEHLEIEILYKNYPYDKELLDSIVALIVETMCSKRKQIRIAGDDKPVEIVRSRFMKLNSEHIKFVMDCFKENTTKIRNIKQYLLATIYNSVLTIDGYFDALVRHDLSED